MWNFIRNKLTELANLDAGCVAFGADEHRYRLGAPATAEDIEDAEASLGVELPTSLQRLYTALGNGGAGPAYGMLPTYRLEGFDPPRPYPGVYSIRAAAADAPDVWPHDDGIISGLVRIVHAGCGHHWCVVTAGGNVGDVVWVSADREVHEEGHGVVELYESWLDQELSTFQAVRDLMNTSKSLEEIEAIMRARQVWRVGEMIASIARISLPDDLFGRPGARIHHRAVQQPWFERTLADWRSRR